MAIGKFIGAAGEVTDLTGRFKPESPENSGCEISGRNSIGIGVCTELVTCAERDSAFDSASGQDDAVAMGPVIAPDTRVYFRRPAKLTHCNHQGFLEESAAIEVGDQRRKRLVRRWNKVILEPAKDIFVSVPVGDLPVMLAIVHRDETDASLDQAASQKNALPKLTQAIAGA